VAVVSNIGIPARQASGEETLNRFRHYEDVRPRYQPTQTGARYAPASPFGDRRVTVW
jgi:hypothetical protein